MKKSILDNFTPEDVNYRKAEFLPGKLHGPCCFYCDRAKHSLSDRSRDCDLLKGEVSDSNVCDWL